MNASIRTPAAVATPICWMKEIEDVMMNEVCDASRVSVRAIARRAGVSPTALYLQFPDRDRRSPSNRPALYATLFSARRPIVDKTPLEVDRDEAFAGLVKLLHSEALAGRRRRERARDPHLVESPRLRDAPHRPPATSVARAGGLSATC